MSDYIYHIGDDYDCINKEYVILSTDKGQQITVKYNELYFSHTIFQKLRMEYD